MVTHTDGNKGNENKVDNQAILPGKEINKAT